MCLPLDLTIANQNLLLTREDMWTLDNGYDQRDLGDIDLPVVDPTTKRKS
jgi:hypothetical protein